MQLRLKKYNENTWSYTQNGVLSAVKRIGDSVYFKQNMSTNQEWTEPIYTWNPKNTYQTEYRKMRKALITYLAPKEEEEFVDPDVYIDELLAEIAELKKKVAVLEETHITAVNKLQQAGEMMVDLRKERTRAVEKHKQLCRINMDLEAKNDTLVKAMANLKIGAIEANRSQAMVKAATSHLINFDNTKTDKLPRTVINLKAKTTGGYI